MEETDAKVSTPTPIQLAVAHVQGPAKLAGILGVTTQAVCFWRDGKRRLPVEYCAQIELATGGKVTRRELRPHDWQNIWPELAEGAASSPTVGAA